MDIITFELKDTVSTNRKIDLIGQTVFESHVDGIINPMVADILFQVNLFLVYTVNNVSDKLKSDKFELYDILMKQGVLGDFEAALDSAQPGEMEYMSDYLESWTQEQRAYLASLSGVISELQTYLDILVEKISINLDMLKDIDLEALAQVVPLAKSLGVDLDGLPQSSRE